MWLPPDCTIPEGTMCFLGINVHKRDSYVTVLDNEEGAVVKEVYVKAALSGLSRPA
ncbi:hypothetical protein [Haladaptatus halobius]|uniref:hypothetical protein n=1 Tax=Haladaptatus halobius TaxID=2884875 RepID=UPI001D0B07F2|nr:hypothetical protein [Haladaptatus halobius]